MLEFSLSKVTGTPNCQEFDNCSEFSLMMRCHIYSVSRLKKFCDRPRPWGHISVFYDVGKYLFNFKENITCV